MKSVYTPQHLAELIARIDTLSPESRRRWGRMTVHQAVCHLNDFLKASLGDRPLAQRPVGLSRRILSFIAFTLPLPWPKGLPTSPEVDAERGGTPPATFEVDVRELKALLERFARTEGKGLGPHYAWGEMGRGAWGRYGYRHVDHHLRQFGA